MEAAPRGVDAAEQTRAGIPGRTSRQWLFGASFFLLLVAWVQRPGEVVALTRLDRVLDPLVAIRRSASIWSPWSDFGSVQRQTIGYLFNFDIPFAAAREAGIPPWIAERLMMAAILAGAAWGFVRLVDALGVGSQAARMAGGLAWAVSPMILSRVGWRTPEALGPALLPWVLVPLIHGATGRSERRAAARSALVVALIGGANAAITLAVLPAPLMYLVTRQRGRRRTRLLVWWAVCVPLAIAWWFAALILLARYGSDQLKITETVEVTTAAATLFNALRGLADWQVPTLPPASMIALSIGPIIASVILVALGLGGLADRRLPERRFLVTLFGLGLLALGARLNGLGGPLGAANTMLLNGPARAFRNVYKFEPLVFLPIVVGLTHALTICTDALLDMRRDRSAPHPRLALLNLALVVSVGVLIAATAAPAWNSSLTRPGFKDLPQAWQRLREYLEENAGGRVLILPGQPEAVYEWGWTSQLPLTWGTTLRSVTRSQEPQGGSPIVALLDTIELAIERGGDPELPMFLARSGFSHIVVPYDSRLSSNDAAPPPERVVDALARSGLFPIAKFGPQRFGALRRSQEIAVFGIEGATPITSYPLASASWLSGDAEGVLRIPSAQFGQRIYVQSHDPLPPGLKLSNWIVTDTNTRVGVDFGRSHNNRSYVLGAKDHPPSFGNALERHSGESQVAAQTVAVRDDIDRVTSSSVGPGPIATNIPNYDPGNVLDGDPKTVWRPRQSAFPASGVPWKAVWGETDPWIELQFAAPRDLSRLDIRFATPPRGRTSVRVVTTTEAGTRSSDLQPTGRFQRLALRRGQSSTLRITLQPKKYPDGTPILGIAELRLPGGPVPRWLRTPTITPISAAEQGTVAPAWVFTRQASSASPFASVDSEKNLRRIFSVPEATTTAVSAAAAATDRPALERALRRIGRPRRGTMPITIQCDDGLAVETSTRRIRFEASPTLNELRYGTQFALRPCDDEAISLPEGKVRLTGTTGPFGTTIEKVVLQTPSATGSPDPQGSRGLAVVQWGPVSRSIDVSPGDSSLVVTDEVFNRGWIATFNGERLAPLVVDGWRQAYWLPRQEAGRLQLEYRPQLLFLIGTAIGFMLLALLVALACAPSRGRDSAAAVGAATWPFGLLMIVAVGLAIAIAGLGALMLIPIWYVGRRARDAALPVLAASAFAGAGASYVLARLDLCVVPQALRCGSFATWINAGSPLVVPLTAISLLAVLASFARRELKDSP